jgi:hypothetical protein
VLAPAAPRSGDGSLHLPALAGRWYWPERGCKGAEVISLYPMVFRGLEE